MSTLFISYSREDKIVAKIFYQKLAEMGYEKPFSYDHPKDGISAGSDWERELYRKLKLCKALIVLYSENWISSKWCFAELVYAKAIGKEVFPVLLDDSTELPSELRQRQAINYSDDNIWMRLRRGLAEADLSPENDFSWPLEGQDKCPYPGLQSFEERHAGVYFGRNDEIVELRERLNQMVSHGEPRLLYVCGASGCGKSSIVRAGLLPRLTQKEANCWCVLPTFRWNKFQSKHRDWQEQLAINLSGVWPTDKADRPDWKTLCKRYSVSPSISADRFIDDTKDMLLARHQPNASPLLLIDQFEELLSATAYGGAKQFLEFLGCLMTSPRSPWISIATVRTDFLSTIQTHPDLVEWKEQTAEWPLYLMKRAKFYEVIRCPAEKVGISFESDSLVDQIVNDTGTNDALPLLAFLLREFYEQCGDDQQFTFKKYNERLGGLEGCLSKVADELFADPVLPEDSSVEVTQKKLLLAFSNHLARLNEQDENKGFVRQPALWSSFDTGVHPFLQRFIDRRLITSRPRDEDDPNSERVIEVAHEALFRKWDRLKCWLDERHDLHRWRIDVERSRAASGEKWSGLTKSQLAIGCDLLEKRSEELTKDEVSWINSGKRAKVRMWGFIFFFGAILVLLAVFLKVQSIKVSRLADEFNARMHSAQGVADFQAHPLHGLQQAIKGWRIVSEDNVGLAQELGSRVIEFGQQGRLGKFGSNIRDVQPITVDDSKLLVRKKYSNSEIVNATTLETKEVIEFSVKGAYTNSYEDYVVLERPGILEDKLFEWRRKTDAKLVGKTRSIGTACGPIPQSAATLFLGDTGISQTLYHLESETAVGQPGFDVMRFIYQENEGRPVFALEYRDDDNGSNVIPKAELFDVVAGKNIFSFPTRTIILSHVPKNENHQTRKLRFEFDDEENRGELTVTYYPGRPYYLLSKPGGETQFIKDGESVFNFLEFDNRKIRDWEIVELNDHQYLILMIDKFVEVWETRDGKQVAKWPADFLVPNSAGWIDNSNEVSKFVRLVKGEPDSIVLDSKVDGVGYTGADLPYFITVQDRNQYRWKSTGKRLLAAGYVISDVTPIKNGLIVESMHEALTKFHRINKETSEEIFSSESEYIENSRIFREMGLFMLNYDLNECDLGCEIRLLEDGTSVLSRKNYNILSINFLTNGDPRFLKIMFKDDDGWFSNEVFAFDGLELNLVYARHWDDSDEKVEIHMSPSKPGNFLIVQPVNRTASFRLLPDPTDPTNTKTYTNPELRSLDIIETVEFFETKEQGFVILVSSNGRRELWTDDSRPRRIYVTKFGTAGHLFLNQRKQILVWFDNGDGYLVDPNWILKASEITEASEMVGYLETGPLEE